MDNERVVMEILDGKKIYIVNSHQYVLLPWKIYIDCHDLPILITFDEHTDTRSAFSHYQYVCKQDPSNFFNKDILRNDVLFSTAVCNLKNDEHIDYALKVGILRKAFVMSFQSSGQTDRYNENIHYIRRPCYEGCPNGPHDDQCQEIYQKRAINAPEVEAMLNNIENIDKTICENRTIMVPYVLDIDLDYFHYEESLTPQDTSAFYKLIRNASIITIAKEPMYTYLDSDLLVDRIKYHIQRAMHEQAN